MSAEDPGCQHSAGVLENGKLSQTTYDKIIDDIIKSGELGFGNVSMFPCSAGKSIGPAIGLVPKDLHDKEKYPDFHKNTMGNFEKIALALDVKGNFSFPPPIMDPFALALKLDLDMPSFDIMKLPTLTPPELILSLGMRMPELPKLTALVSIPKPPDFSAYIPSIDLNVNLPKPGLDAKFQFQMWPLKLLDLVMSLTIPPKVDFIFGLLKVPPDVCPVIEQAVDAKLFGPTASGDLTKVIVVQELATFTGQCATIAVTSLLVGDGGGPGLTGNLGTQFGFKQATPVTGNTEHQSARNTLTQAYKSMFNTEPTVKELQFAQCIATLENHYGKAWVGGRKQTPPEAYRSNNWGNIHGSGPAGSFVHIDYDANNNQYKTTFAMYPTPVDGAKALLNELFVKRSYVRDAILNKSNLYTPIYYMSSKAVLGSGYRQSPPTQGADAMFPMSSGGLTYYEADPGYYFDNNAKPAMKQVIDSIGEPSEFDLESKVLQ